MQDSTRSFVSNIVKAAESIAIAVNEFRNNLKESVLSFLSKLEKGIKRFVITFKNRLDKKIEEAVEKAKSSINTARKELLNIRKEHIEWNKIVLGYSNKRLVDEKDRLGNIRNFTRKIVKGLGIYTSNQLCVDLIRLADLGKKVEKLERTFGDVACNILKDSNKILSEVESRYSEYYVRQQINSVRETCRNIKDSQRKLCRQLELRINSLKFATEQYKKIELMLYREIKA